MKILFTGASSFTGYWFAKQLAAAGHAVHTTFTQPDVASYGDNVRGRRVRQIVEITSPTFACRFGDDRFASLLKEHKFDVLCHHAADVTNYKSPDFDLIRALSNNTNAAEPMLSLLSATDGAALILTGSVFEAGEGAGSDNLPSFSPYGVSKMLTAITFAFYSETYKVPLGKFVIANPFGPYEEPRFTAYLMQTWKRGAPAEVRTPAYVRDNIHVSLLSLAYADFVARVHAERKPAKLNPSGYVETQGEFAERVAREVRSRTGWPCELKLHDQTTFDEPRERVNTDTINAAQFDWNEPQAWDEFVNFYRDLH